MSKKYLNSEELRSKLMTGVDQLAANVSTTMGPRGRNVIIQLNGQNPIITKDGVTVARSVHLEDEFEDLGAQIVKQATAKTNSEAGDGTTTSTVLTHSMLKLGFSALRENVSVTDLKRGMDTAKEDVISVLKEASTDMNSMEEIRHVATISSNGDEEITNLITKAVTSVGKGGSVTVEEARSNSSTLDLSEGFSFDSGYAAQAFVTDDRLSLCRYENPLFLVTDERLETVEQILPTLEIAARESRPLVIVSDEIEGQALASLIMNTVRGSMKVAAVKAPRYGEERRQIMQDLSISLGAKYFTQTTGSALSSSKVSLEDFGSAKTVVLTKRSTTIVGGLGSTEDVSNRIAQLDSEIEEESSDSALSVLLERRNRLVSGIAVIRVGAPTEVEMIEKKHRVEDALEAVRSAQQEGYLPGGGMMLYVAHCETAKRPSSEPSLNPDFIKGYNIVRESLLAPLETLIKNSQEDRETVIAGINYDLQSSEYIGFNFRSGSHVNLVEEGIIDPTKVTRCALINAVSAASTLLTTNAAIVEH